MAQKVYLLTGGAGNLARQIAARLVRGSDRVILFDLVPVLDRLPARCYYVQGDIMRRKTLVRLFDKSRPTHVLHLAAILSGKSEVSRELAWQVNATASFELLELACARGVHRFFFPSTTATYGGVLPVPLPEDHPQWPEGLYGATKVAVERLGVYYHERHGLDFRGVRLPVVVSRHAPPGAASAYCSRAFVDGIARGHFTFPVTPETRLATVYVEDVVDGIVRLLTAPAARLTRRLYNITAFSCAAGEVAEAIWRRIPDVAYDFAPDPAVMTLAHHWVVDLIDASARRDWGWKPRFDLPRMTSHLITALHQDTGGH